MITMIILVTNSYIKTGTLRAFSMNALKAQTNAYGRHRMVGMGFYCGENVNE